MLQNKLLIAMGALTLAACGGSLDLGPKIPAPVQETPGNGNGNGACETIPGQAFTYDFTAAEQVDDWFINGDGENVRLEHDAEASAMLVQPLQWADEENWRRQARFQLEETTDLSNATVTVEFYLPETYVEDGGLALQLVVQGDDGLYTDNYLGVGSFEAGENTWTWEMGGAAGADYFGFQLAVEPNDLTILDDLVIFNVTIQTPGEEICDEEPELLTMELDMTDGWLTQANYQDTDGEAPPFEYVSEGVMVMIDDVNQQLVHPVDGPIDFRRAEVVFSISVDATYLSTASALQPFQQVFIRGEDEDGEEDNDEVGGNWDCWTGIGNWTEAGEPIDVECNLTNSDMWNLEEGEFMYFGAQSQGEGVEGSFTIHSVTIQYYGEGAPEEPPVEQGESIEVSLTEGWDAGERPVDYVEGGVSYSTNADDQQFIYTIEGPMTLTGGSFDITVSGDEDFIASGAAIQPFAQGIEDGGIAYWGCWINGGSNLEDGPVEHTCEDIGSFEIPEGESFKIGVQGKGQGGNPVAGTITIHNLVIHPTN